MPDASQIRPSSGTTAQVARAQSSGEIPRAVQYQEPGSGHVRGRQRTPKRCSKAPLPSKIPIRSSRLPAARALPSASSRFRRSYPSLTGSDPARAAQEVLIHFSPPGDTATDILILVPGELMQDFERHRLVVDHPSFQFRETRDDIAPKRARVPPRARPDHTPPDLR